MTAPCSINALLERQMVKWFLKRLMFKNLKKKLLLTFKDWLFKANSQWGQDVKIILETDIFIDLSEGK